MCALFEVRRNKSYPFMIWLNSWSPPSERMEVLLPCQAGQAWSSAGERAPIHVSVNTNIDFSFILYIDWLPCKKSSPQRSPSRLHTRASPSQVSLRGWGQRFWVSGIWTHCCPKARNPPESLCWAWTSSLLVAGGTGSEVVASQNCLWKLAAESFVSFPPAVELSFASDPSQPWQLYSVAC